MVTRHFILMVSHSHRHWSQTKRREGTEMKTEAQRQWDCPEKQHTGGISLFTAQLISKRGRTSAD